METKPRTKAAWWPLVADHPDTEVVARRPAGVPHTTVVPRLYFRESFPPPSGTFPLVHTPPELRLERLTNVVLGPNRVLLAKDPPGLMEASFNRIGHLRHPDFRVADGRARAREPQRFATIQPLDEPVYWADTHYPDIYGHLLLEVLPQLWGHREAGVRKVATSVVADRTCLVLMQALGIDPDDIVPITGCIAPSAAYVATPTVMLRDYVHPHAREMFARLAALGERSDAPTPERLYVSRSRGRRRILRNEAAVEAIFEAAGFATYHPQEHPIEDQIRTFSRARLIAGPGGSAMHNAIFSPDVEKVLILTSPDWFTIIDPLLHQQEGRLGLLFGTVTEGQDDVAAGVRDWTIDEHQVRLALLFHMGV